MSPRNKCGVTLVGVRDDIEIDTSNKMQQQNKPLEEASEKRHYTVTEKDLPLCCPMPDMKLWNSHPRVYLPIEETGLAMCPYCGAEYALVKSS